MDGDSELGLEPLHQGDLLNESSSVCLVGENQPNGYDGQFFHDDVDDAADFAEVDDGLLAETPAEGDEDDLWAGAQGLKKAKPETVNYAKRAKRVDVKRLKDNIWKGLKIPSRPSKDEAEETEVSLPLTRAVRSGKRRHDAKK